MFMNDNYQYYDNDNNTIIYFDRILSDNTNNYNISLGISYEIDKLFRHNDIQELFLCLRYENKIHGIYNTDNKNIAEKNVLLSLLNFINNIDGIGSHDIRILNKLFDRNINVSLINSIMSNVITTKDLNVLNNIMLEKNNAIKKQDYESAAELRQKELNFIKTLKNENKS